MKFGGGWAKLKQAVVKKGVMKPKPKFNMADSLMQAVKKMAKKTAFTKKFMNLTKEEILAKLMAKDHDNITTTYYLLLKRFQRMEEEERISTREACLG